MSPRSIRYPSPAPGDTDATAGRHRRPESLADVSHAGTRRPPRPSDRRPDTRVARRRAQGGRHARPQSTGSHRAPATLALQSFALPGKRHQQIVLASLVAAALLILAAVPKQRGIDAVDAAVAGAIGVHVNPKQAHKSATKPPADTVADGAAKAAEPSAKPTSPSARATEAAAALPATGKGPGHSLRTTGTSSIALTFDDGPDPVETPKMLALLAKYHVKATFCLIGQNVEKHPEIVREIVAAGHTLCDHTWNHSLTIGKETPAQIQADLARTNAAIRAAVPGAQIPFFRAPGGNFTDRLVSVAADNGMASLYWQIDPRDWDHPAGETDAAHITKVITAIRKAKPGSIILSHDFNQPDTIAAYTQLLPWLTSHFTIALPDQGTPASSAPTDLPSSASPSATPSATDSPTPDPSVSVSPTS